MTSTELVLRPSTAAIPIGDLAVEITSYLLFKKKRLTDASERGYRATLSELVAYFPTLNLDDFQPPYGITLLEQFLSAKWGARAPRTYNKNLAVISDFFKWQARRGRITGNPTLTVEKAKERQVHRTTFSTEQRAQILTANPELRDQIALRLLLDYGIRKGALRGVRFEHFDETGRRLTVFTKGEKIHHVPIPDQTVWEALAELAEPGNHYLLPRQLMRRRTPPNRRQLTTAGTQLEQIHETLAVVGDPACRRELDATLEAVAAARAALNATVAAASVQIRRFLAEQTGEHALHDWWYRCLQRAGIVEKGVTRGKKMHAARHTAGQRVLDVTGNLKAAQMLLGHASVQTTGDIYVAHDEQQLAETMRAVLTGDGR